MKVIFAILAALFYLGGFGGCTLAKTSIGEIAGLLCIVVGTLFFVGAGIIDAQHEIRDILKKLLQ